MLTNTSELVLLKCQYKCKTYKHNAELQRTAPDTQDTEAFSTRGRLFFFLFLVVTTGLDLVPDISIKAYLHVHVAIQWKMLYSGGIMFYTMQNGEMEFFCHFAGFLSTLFSEIETR